MKDPGLFQTIRRAANTPGGLEEAKDALWSRYGETLALLVMDSTGFTRITRARGILFYLSIIAWMRELARPILKAHGGTDIRFEADNAYAHFPDPDAALAGAMALQQAIAGEEIEMLPGDYYQGCIGIGYGRVLRAGKEGVYGDEMNLASKLGEDTAESGDILLSSSAFAALEDHQGFTFRPEHLEIGGVEVEYYKAIRK